MSTRTHRQSKRKDVPFSGQGNDHLLTREWLVTNGLGGYASGTVSGVATRRYHGLLISALPAPFGRMLLLAHLSEQFRQEDGTIVRLGGDESTGSSLRVYGADNLESFHLESGIPVWRYRVGDLVLEKRIFMPHGQNTTFINYRLIEGPDEIRLKLLPSVHCRSHDAPVSTPLPEPFTITSCQDRHELTAANNLPPLRMLLHGESAAFTLERQHLHDMVYRIERGRGYQSSGDIWSPGYFRVDLTRDSPATLVASTEQWATIEALSPESAWDFELQRRKRLLAAAHPAARHGLGAELVLAADQFLIKPAGRIEDAAVAQAAGDEARTVIAGYHWFTDWGRDTMISLEGLTLTTGRHAEAGYILRTFATHIRNGLIPNLFPEGGTEGLYHTADATLWFFHALSRYIEVTDDRVTLDLLLPKLRDIVARHIEGTRFGIGVDPVDGLLKQGAPGYQLTWMDAKVGDWVVTPRRGKAVEINALWYNALCLLENWVRESGDAPGADELAGHAIRARKSFNKRFWYQDGEYLYDVVDGEQGDDSACRPNQVLAISLTHPVLEENRWRQIMRVVENRLLTPNGLRTLAPGHPDFKAVYDGDLRSRDAAYHQGTVWAWLIGPYIDAWLKIHTSEEQRAQARGFLSGFEHHMSEACIGSISEIFDADAPYWPRGCVAQAWSVAEVLRCWIRTSSKEKEVSAPNPESVGTRVA
ncbi:MAG: putative glycogen debranching enzyme [Planctomycetaceae bacterium]|nr:putative glycogen debranching enzyme [Planctomycetaceae bacterium]